MKLIAYLRDHDLSDEDFAARVGKSKWAVRKWMYGQRVPRANEMQAIMSITEGAVTANDFLPDGDPTSPFPAPGGAAEDERGAA